eukprot:12191508-Alexandrium_andersonii.AAC.1
MATARTTAAATATPITTPTDRTGRKRRGAGEASGSTHRRFLVLSLCSDVQVLVSGRGDP